MEAREIIIANTKTQKRYKLESAATTLGELKAEMTSRQIDYSGMSFTEGISKTQLLDDTTPLPTNLSYKGQTTNNLVILLTNTEKKIASGCSTGSRKDAYDIIKEEGLADEIKEAFNGVNFTHISTSDLWEFINNREDEEVDDEKEEDLYDSDTADAEYYKSMALNQLYNTIHYLFKADVITIDQLNCLINRLQTLANANAKPNPVSMTIGGATVNGDDVDSMIKDLI